MPTVQQAQIEETILSLLQKQEKITLREIAATCGLSATSDASRRFIQRALTALINAKKIEIVGAARSRSYRIPTSPKKEHEHFKHIALSPQSIRLLDKLLIPLPKRKKVEYCGDFLKKYQPNKTQYLSSSVKKILHAAGQPELNVRPAGTYARMILNRLLIDLSWNSSRLEGNTYSLLETKRLIEFGELASGKNIMETQMILNHKNAIEYLVGSAEDTGITLHFVRSMHALLSENLLGDSSASGRIRNLSVGISGSAYQPLANPHLLQEYLTIFINKFNQIQDPFEQSFFALTHLSYLQAFEDVNKRTARLIANFPLIQKNLRPLSFTSVDQTDYVLALLGIYEKNDTCLLQDYYQWAYLQSCERYSAVQKTTGQPSLLTLKYYTFIHDLTRDIILKQISGNAVLTTIQHAIASLKLSEADTIELCRVIENELINLHDGNISLYKILPSEFERWCEINKK